MSESASGWTFIKRHKAAFASFVAAAVAIAIWAVYVFWWFTGNAQSTGLVPSTLALWTMGNLVNFIIYSILWEILLVGIPVAAGAIGAWMWWRRLPYDERMGYHWRGRRSAGGSGGVGGLLFIAFAIKVYFDGNWNAPFSSYTLNYVVGSMITILAYVAVIVGIPVAVGLTWWISRHMKSA
jgi:hypothetical protein